MLGTLPRALRRALILGLLLLSTASAADELALIDKTEPLGPGITLRHLKTVDATGWYDHQVLTADLSNAAVESDSLWAGTVAKGGPLSEAADHAGAVAGVNADFFDIGNSTRRARRPDHRRHAAQEPRRRDRLEPRRASARTASAGSST